MKLCSRLQLDLNTDNAEGNGQSWKEDESVYVQGRQNNKTQVPILLHKKIGLLHTFIHFPYRRSP